MLEILLFIGALGGIGTRAHQRGLNRTAHVTAAAVGWILVFILSVTALGPVGVLLRWGWLGCVYVFVELSHGGAKVSDLSWQCPECTSFNEGSTLVCLCGYKHPEAPNGVQVSSDSAGEHDGQTDG